MFSIFVQNSGHAPKKPPRHYSNTKNSRINSGMNLVSFDFGFNRSVTGETFRIDLIFKKSFTQDLLNYK